MSKLEAVFVRSPIPAMPNVKIHGHNVLQNNPTEIKANTLTIPEENIPINNAAAPRIE
jgi:hypothetical protein